MKKIFNTKLQKILIFAALLFLRAHFAFAEATSESDLQIFLEEVGSWLITIVGPTVLVIGIAISGVSIALGDEQGMRRGALAAGGGALILLSRAMLDLIQNITGF